MCRFARPFCFGYLPLMNKIKNVPDDLRLEEPDVIHLSLLRAWVDVFPATLRQHARFKLHHLRRAIWTREISAYLLLGAAYIGFAPLPVNYGRFMIEAERINKREHNPSFFLRDAVARESSALEAYELSRGEFKRLLKRLDDFAVKFGDIASYADVFNCKNVILNDPSPFAPEDREAYADGPLHLWDFAKAVNEHKLADMVFGTFQGWVVFLHLENGVVQGHAINPLAHRFGNFTTNPLIDLVEIVNRDPNTPSTIIDVPVEVQQAVSAMAKQHFPERPFRYIPPPFYVYGEVTPAALINPNLYHHRSEA